MISDILDENKPSSSSFHVSLPPLQFNHNDNCLQSIDDGEECSPIESDLGDCKERAESPLVDTDSPPSSQNSEQGLLFCTCFLALLDYYFPLHFK